VVYASRFQATHLAQTMRGLFPVDLGADPRVSMVGQSSRAMTGSVSPSRPSTVRTGPGNSRPNPTATRSPTVPPVVAPTPITAGSYRMTQSQSHSVPVVPPLPPGFLKRPMVGVPGWVVMSALLLLGFAFVGGAIYTLRGTPTPVALPTIQLLDLAFESSPMGADVFVVGSNEYLGRTPFRRKVEYRTDRTTFVVYRLAGYLETTREVRQEWAGAVTLQPAPAPVPAPPRKVVTPPPAPPPAIAPTPVPPSPPSKGAAVERPKRHGKGKKGKGVAPANTDPFESATGKPGGSGRKSSPFD